MDRKIDGKAEPMIPIISIVGKSDSGKTTLIEKLIHELRKRGYRVATVKHDIHGFEIDHEGKDSWRHKSAGADQVIISSPKRIAMIRDTDKDHSLEELRRLFIRDVDIILSEGYKRGPHPKIEVFRKERETSPLCSKEDNLIAMASNVAFDIEAPCLDINDAQGLADLIEKDFLLKKARHNK
jgi:molybdopterin-guanine dinucleotide biosynthesis protein B